MSNDHPYRRQPTRAFWSRSVATGWNALDLIPEGAPLIRKGDKVASAGSCFAGNIIEPLEQAGFTYLRTHRRHPALGRWDAQGFGYDVFSAAYGNIYTARQLLQLFRRANGSWSPKEDRWEIEGRIIDPFRPGLRYPAVSSSEYDALMEQHLRETRHVFEQADVFVFTLGLTEAWTSLADGAVFPASPGTVAGRFSRERHWFQNFTVAEVVEDLNAFTAEAAAINPAMRIILTVSPVPLVATAEDDHVLVASTYSKAVLRAAAGEVSQRHGHVSYFPAFEIVTGPQAPQTYFEADRRNPSEEAIAEVMRTLIGACEVVPTAAAPVPAAAAPDMQLLSTAVAEAECEEAMNDRHSS